MPEPSSTVASILVVEDEETIQELLRYNLARAGHEVRIASTGKEAVALAANDPPTLVLLDLMLPDMNGLEVCRKLRAGAQTSSLPIIMLTARGEESDIVRGLEIGADDYVTKPFNFQVLFARIKAVLRRRDDAPEDQEALALGPVTLHAGRGEVRVEGEGVELTNTEFRILYTLMKRPGWVYTRKQIVDAVRSEHYAVTERSVDVQIVSVRKKLGIASRLVETVRGVGYRFRDERD